MRCFIIDAVMKSFIRRGLDGKLIEAVSDEEKASASRSTSPLFLVDVTNHPWMPEGVVCHWEPLNRTLRSKSTWRVPRVVADLGSLSDGQTSITSIALRRPWELCTLDPRAANMSCFLAGEGSEADARVLYRFIRGPPGQVSVRDDIQRKLEGVVSQLRRGGVHAQLYLSTIVISDAENRGFDALLAQTGATYRALKGAGLDIDGAQSNLEPRAVVDYGSGCWSTVRYGSLKAEVEEYAAILTQCFFVWLEDRYTWLCEPPIRAEGVAIESEFAVLLNAVTAKSNMLGLDRALLTEERDELLRCCQPLLVSRAAPEPGPQRWSLLEFRCLLHACELVAASA